ncbi:putative disease resistance protein RGA4 [Cinnamomum micranthum f. kanehirae]|uniref:Putative disease resistance protein RGA4 n=1 Tax=Cinnamomum micranthum f. kanehirae TaxID=337451 RepID=A0A443NBD3_9MAGN|nr:putative disease resistance protein RGA4 [Cinnamomum micranthum f. kanehirae]
MELTQGNIMHSRGGNNPMVQGDIKADNGAIINLGQVTIAVYKKRKKRKRKKEDEQENMALTVVKDTATSYTVQGAWDMVKSCLQIGVDLFRGAKDSLVKIEVSLRVINNFIVIAEGSPKMDHKLMKLLEILKDAAYDAQDLLEEYAIEDRGRSEEDENCMSVRDTMTNKVRKVVTSVRRSPVASPIIMRKKLKELSERLEAIKAEAHAFQLEEKVNSLQIEFKKQRETHSSVNESYVFERDEEKEKIVNWLLSNQAGNNENVSVISIVGIGGIGKTTLAKLVFNHEPVQNHFELRLWICVSYDFDITRLGNEIIELATSHNPSLSTMEKLQRRLGETLSGKKFLLVLDDVWNEDPQKWDRLRDLLLCGGRGSRIVVTTRILKVAFIMSRVQPHILKPLSEDGCWSLFCQKVFLEEAVHPNLAPIGREIVKKCRGIPLAVVTLGGLLRSERSRHKWEFVRDSEMWNLDDENENAILPALRLSYSHLKPHLKQCFAFCAIFPQDYEIKKELVIKLWMAQGFIPTHQEGLMELEDTGDEIFNELVMKSFFQDVKEDEGRTLEEGNDFDRIRTTFRMHDLMHDLAHSVMENEYRVVLDGKSKEISPRIRHVSSNGLGILAASLPKAQMLRTYVMLERVAFQFPCDVGLFKCLRALDFMRQRDKQEVKKQLLTSLGNLQHLRYLNLSCTLIKMLPESLTSLWYLQTLILIQCTELCQLPKEMSKLTNLRCLDITDCDKLTHMPQKMRQLSCLQELSNFIVGRTNEIACSGIGELQGLNLRGHLKIQLLKNAIHVPGNILINIPNFTCLDLLWERSETLRFLLKEHREPKVHEEQVLKGLQPHQSLKKLTLFGYGGPSFPSWMMDTTLTKLVEIKLSGCWGCKHLPPLGGLPSLKVLAIDGLKNVECIGNEFYGNEASGGFPSLKKLRIYHMFKLETWPRLEWTGKRAFPSLVKLDIRFCPMITSLEVFPSSLQWLDIFNCEELIFSDLRLHHLSSLKHLEIRNCNKFAHVADELSFLTSLQYLRLDGCPGLKSLPEGIGNLTSLRSLGIYNCPEMASLPRVLQCLSALKVLEICGCFLSLKIRCTEDTGEAWDKIQQIPYIRILDGVLEEEPGIEDDEDYELVP